MSLLELKQHLMQIKVTSLDQLATHFHCDPDLMRSMLTHWVRKGCLRHFCKTPLCGKGCGACKASDYELYEWL